MEVKPSLLLENLFKIGAIKTGSFKLKSGLISPIYIDLRVIISYPNVLSQISQLMWEKVHGEEKSQFSLICGVPYTALPIATCMALEHSIPLIMRRKEGAKDYGTKKQLEGVFQKGEQCLVIEDLVTTGGSVIEVVESLQKEGLVVKDVVVFLDREQGAKKILAQRNLKLHSVFTMSSMLQLLEDKNMLEKSMIDSIRNFISSNQIEAPPSTTSKPLSYGQRASLSKNPMAAKLLKLMEEKQTNLAVAADVTTKAELLHIADTLGKDICVLKTHIDIIEDFDQDLTKELVALSEKHRFMIFEDRKFADIGNTVKLQYSTGMYRISSWAHIVNAHILPGPGIIDGMKSVISPENRGLLLIAEMSSGGALATGEYTQKAVQMAHEHTDFVMGFISQSKLSDEPGLIHMTPGVQLNVGGDTLGQQYNTPSAVIEKGSDVIIVGRGITADTANMQSKAREYREAGWNAYLNRLKQ